MRRIIFFRRLIRVFAPLAGVMLILIALPSFISPKPLPGGFRRQALALELVQNPDDIEQITRVYPLPEVDRDLKLDTFVFIPLYVLLFLSISLWLAGSNVPLFLFP